MSNIYEFNVNGDIYGLNFPSVSRTVTGGCFILNEGTSDITLDPFCINMISFKYKDINWVGHRLFNDDESKLIKFSVSSTNVSSVPGEGTAASLNFATFQAGEGVLEMSPAPPSDVTLVSSIKLTISGRIVTIMGIEESTTGTTISTESISDDTLSTGTIINLYF